MQGSLNTYVSVGIPVITSFIGAAVGAFFTYWFAPRMNEKFTLRKDYYVDYRKWCSDFCGAILEYKYLLKLVNNMKDDDHNYLILHFWEIHSVISAGHKWEGKLEKEMNNKAVYKNIEGYRDS